MNQFSRSRSLEHNRHRRRNAFRTQEIATSLRRGGWATVVQVTAMVLLPLLILVYAIRAAADVSPDNRGDTPATVVRMTTEQLQALIGAHRTAYLADRRVFHTAVDGVVSPAFDLDYASQLVLARAWRSASEEQRTRFRNAFKDKLIDLYGDALLDQTASYDVRWLQTNKSTDGTQATVHANVSRKDGPPVPVAFALRRGDDGAWRVYDVALDAISLVTSFRAQYTAVVRAQGLDGLIRELEAEEGSAAGDIVQARR